MTDDDPRDRAQALAEALFSTISAHGIERPDSMIGTDANIVLEALLACMGGYLAHSPDMADDDQRHEQCKRLAVGLDSQIVAARQRIAADDPDAAPTGRPN